MADEKLQTDPPLRSFDWEDQIVIGTHDMPDQVRRDLSELFMLFLSGQVTSIQQSTFTGDENPRREFVGIESDGEIVRQVVWMI